MTTKSTKAKAAHARHDTPPAGLPVEQPVERANSIRATRANDAAMYVMLDAACRVVSDTAYATIKATPKARKALAHIDATQHLMMAAVELFGVAMDIAEGASVRGHGAKIGPCASQMAISLRIAEAKMRETGWMLDKAERRQNRRSKAADCTATL